MRKRSRGHSVTVWSSFKTKVCWTTHCERCYLLGFLKRSYRGEVAEWFKAHAWNACVG